MSEREKEKAGCARQSITCAPDVGLRGNRLAIIGSCLPTCRLLPHPPHPDHLSSLGTTQDFPLNRTDMADRLAQVAGQVRLKLTLAGGLRDDAIVGV